MKRQRHQRRKSNLPHSRRIKGPAAFFIMQIELQQVRPVFMEPEKIAASAIWTQSLHFAPGEWIQIVAPSGSGKTSLIHFLYGLRRDYDGQICYDGQPIRQLGAEGFARYRQQQISVVFQDMRLFADQSVADNINIKRVLYPFHPLEKIAEMADRLGIGNKLTRMAGTCSYGEQQRIAIIRSLMQPFSILLLDEPFSHLDEHNRHIAMALLLEEARHRNAAIILADLKRLDYFPATRILNL